MSKLIKRRCIMKKIITILLSMFCICLCITMTNAKETKFKNANELFQYWEEYGYPNYICGVWSSLGGQTNLTFAVLDNEAGEKGKNEIIALLEDDSTVSFVYQKYTLNYFFEIMDEIESYFINVEYGKNIGLCGMEIDCYNNCLQIKFLEEKKGQKGTIDFINTITQKYGDAILIKYANQLSEAQQNISHVNISKQVNNSLDNIVWFCFPVFLIILLFFLLWIIKRLKICQ